MPQKSKNESQQKNNHQNQISAFQDIAFQNFGQPLAGTLCPLK